MKAYQTTNESNTHDIKSTAFSFTSTACETAALQTAADGDPVFPCNAGKKPYTKNGFKNATQDPEKIARWWKRWPNALIGIPTGKRIRRFVIDVDDLRAIRKLPGRLPETYTVRTQSGGLHFYYQYEEGITNSPGGLPDGIDCRGQGGYAIVPPSPGYTVIRDDPVAPAPKWLIELLKKRQKSSQPVVNPSPKASLGGWGSKVNTEDTGPIPDGRRNQTLTSIAGKLRAQGFDRETIYTSLLEINSKRCNPPLPSDEVASIATSISRYAAGSSASSAPPDETALELLDKIESHFWDIAWPKIAGKSERSIAIKLIELARKRGRPHPDGIEVSVDRRSLALACATSRKSVARAIDRSDFFKAGKRGEGTKAGSIILLTPGGEGAQRVPTITIEEGIECKETTKSNCGVPLRAPLSAPRLRWSAPGIKRLGKSREAVIDYLEAQGGSLLLENLAALMHIARPRDLRRRTLALLEDAGIVEIVGDTVSLAENWQAMLEREREVSGEIDKLHRDMKKFELQREAYRRRCETEPELVPEMPQTDDLSTLWSRHEEGCGCKECVSRFGRVIGEHFRGCKCADCHTTRRDGKPAPVKRILVETETPPKDPSEGHSLSCECMDCSYVPARYAVPGRVGRGS